jgi:hypothetical protein
LNTRQGMVPYNQFLGDQTNFATAQNLTTFSAQQ